MSYPVKSIVLSTGVVVEYVEHGDPSGVPVVLLHGVTDSWRSFEHVLPHLDPSVHAFALTQRGHGNSDRPASGYRTRDFAADVAAFLDAAGLDRVILVGHSMGATDAQRFAIDYPERLLGLVLVNSFSSYRGNPVVEEFWTTAVSQLNDPIDPAFVREFQQSTLHRPATEEFLNTVVGESLKVPARVWREVFEGFLEDDTIADLGKIRVPTLVIWGAHDAFCRRSDQDTLLASIAGSRLIVYEETGHALHWEEPERFATDLMGFAHDFS